MHGICALTCLQVKVAPVVLHCLVMAVTVQAVTVTTTTTMEAEQADVLQAPGFIEPPHDVVVYVISYHVVHVTFTMTSSNNTAQPANETGVVVTYGPTNDEDGEIRAEYLVEMDVGQETSKFHLTLDMLRPQTSYRLFIQAFGQGGNTSNATKTVYFRTARPFHGQSLVTPEEVIIIGIVLLIWIVAVISFIKKWGKIRTLEPREPRFRHVPHNISQIKVISAADAETAEISGTRRSLDLLLRAKRLGLLDLDGGPTFTNGLTLLKPGGLPYFSHAAPIYGSRESIMRMYRSTQAIAVRRKDSWEIPTDVARTSTSENNLAASKKPPAVRKQRKQRPPPIEQREPTNTPTDVTIMTPRVESPTPSETSRQSTKVAECSKPLDEVVGERESGANSVALVSSFESISDAERCSVVISPLSQERCCSDASEGTPPIEHV